MGESEETVKRILWATVAALAAGLILGGVSLASGGPANPGNPMVINLLSRATAINTFVDTGPAGFSSGDLYVLINAVMTGQIEDA